MALFANANGAKPKLKPSDFWELSYDNKQNETSEEDSQKRLDKIQKLIEKHNKKKRNG